MYAVIEQGSKQYKVAEGDSIKIELTDIAPDATTIELDKVLLISDDDDIKVGTPYVDGGKVVATVKSHGRHKKVEIVKFNRRKHYDKRTGHRQNYTELEVTSIQAG